MQLLPQHHESLCSLDRIDFTPHERGRFARIVFVIVDGRQSGILLLAMQIRRDRRHCFDCTCRLLNFCHLAVLKQSFLF